jgi:D-serine dehydratase
MLDVSSILQCKIEPVTKGMPLITDGLPVSRLPALSLNLLRNDLSFPVMVIRESALMGNIRSLQRAADDAGVSLAPHGKTTMAPQIFDLQLTAGAWAMTLASVQQVAIAASFGVSRIILANSVTADADIARLCSLHPDCEIIISSDSLAHVKLLCSRLKNKGLERPLPVLVELGIPGKRTGCRTLSEVQTVLDEIVAHPDLLMPAGVIGYEGLLETGNREEEAKAVRLWMAELMLAADCVSKLALYNNECIISAGGSAFIDLVLEFMRSHQPAYPHRFVLRSGCAVVQDDGWYAGFAQAMAERGILDIRLQPALELWAIVQGRPEAETVILSFGKRDCPYDAGLPVPKFARINSEQAFTSPSCGLTPPTGPLPLATLDPTHYRIEQVYDQHARLACPAESPLAVGDLVACGISHPCGAFDRWLWLPTINENYSVTDLIRTFF